jgi:hypothetical protein
MKKVLILKYDKDTILINIDHIISIHDQTQIIVKANETKPSEERRLIISTSITKYEIVINENFSISKLQRFFVDETKFFEIKESK